MSAMSDYLEEALLKLLFKDTALSAPDIYVALHTADPLDDASGTEVSGGSYARAATDSGDWDAPVTSGNGKRVYNGEDISFPDATGSWGTVNYFAIWDSSSGGNMLFRALLNSTRYPGNGDAVKFSAGDIWITFY